MKQIKCFQLKEMFESSIYTFTVKINLIVGELEQTVSKRRSKHGQWDTCLLDVKRLHAAELNQDDEQRKHAPPPQAAGRWDRDGLETLQLDGGCSNNTTKESLVNQMHLSR